MDNRMLYYLGLQSEDGIVVAGELARTTGWRRTVAAGSSRVHAIHSP